MPTALELTRKGWGPYIEAARHRATLPEPTPSDMKEREKLLQSVRNAADILKSRFGAKKVILFGSLAHNAWFTSKSDIDLAVEGLDVYNYWKSWGVIEKIITDRVVDLVDLETARESLRKEIREYGIEL
jgi:predicted nucleotidyltransferase